MARTVGNVTVTWGAAGLLTLGVVAWIWASIYSEHFDSQFREEPTPTPPETRAPQQDTPSSQAASAAQEDTPSLLDANTVGGLRRAGARLRSWVTRHTAPEKGQVDQAPGSD
jgi:hypothetical protein